MSDIGISLGLDTGNVKKDTTDYIRSLKDIIDAAEKLEKANDNLNKSLKSTTTLLGENAKKHKTFNTAINKSDSSLNRLKDRLAKVQGNMEGYERVLQKAAGSNTKVQTAVKSTNRDLERQTKQLKQTSAGWKLMRTVMATIGTITLARGLTDVTVSLESVRAAMSTVFKDGASDEFDFVRDTALRLGQDLRSLAKDYTQLAAAGKAAGFETKQTRDIFLSLTETSRALSLSTVDTQRAIRAVNQMMSKGYHESDQPLYTVTCIVYLLNCWEVLLRDGKDNQQRSL